MSAPLSQKGSLRAFAFVLLLMASALPAEAGSVWLMWDANRETDLKGYVVLWGTSSHAYTGIMDVGARTSAAVPNLKEGVRYYFAVRAYNTTGLASGPSGEVSAVVSRDANDNGLPDSWETRYGLNSTEATGTSIRNADSDQDGVPNFIEYQRGTHPRGTEVQYLPEGVQSQNFWNTNVALVNPGTAPARVVVVFERADGQLVTHPMDLAARARTTLSASAFAELNGADFATRVESDVPLVVDRTVSWDSRAYGAHAETGTAAPARRWYITEGATSPFWLFYLIQNPGEQAARVRVTYLLESGAPEQRTYDLAPHSRKTIFVNNESRRLAGTPVSGVIESVNGVPIIAERAMYYDAPGTPWAAGSASAAVTRALPRWLFAEGAANSWFD
ncbi:MAG: fibronectin type III domain-containing protein, partial [Vicinamibacteraceae bacterium]